MAGGTDDEGASVLETPPLVLAVVFGFFLVVTLGTDWIIHKARRFLKRRGKLGLLAALDTMTQELMLLGVATLILLVVERNVIATCVNAHDYKLPTWLDAVDGCACCLAHTHGVSECFIKARGCLSASAIDTCCEKGLTPGHNRICPAELVSLYGTVADTMHRRLLAATGGAAGAAAPAKHECVGRAEAGVGGCPPGQRPAVSLNALHEVHTFIFIMAITHIVTCALLIVCTTLRIRAWRRWEKKAPSPADVAAAVANKKKARIELTAVRGGDDDKPAVAADEEAAAAASATATVDAAAAPLSPWRQRPEHLVGVWPRVREAIVCLGRQLLPNVISRREYLLLRSAFLTTHRVHEAPDGNSFSFSSYCEASFDDDAASVVGLGLPMWLLLIGFMLLSDRLGWCVWLFTIFAGAMLLVISTKLVSIIRFAARAGGPHPLSPSAFWLRRPWLLLPPIKLLLFFTSLVWSNAIFFAATFGPHSCFFSRTGFQSAPISWWGVVVVSIIYFLVLAFNTMPLYSIAVQLGADHKPHILPPGLARHFAAVASARKSSIDGGGSAVGSTSRGRLARLVSRAVPRQADAAAAGSVAKGSERHVAHAATM